MPDLHRLDPLRADVRAVRAGVLAAPAVVSAALAHGEAGGCEGALALVLATALCWCGAVAALTRRRSAAALLGWLLGAQVVTHVVVELFCGATSPAQHLAHGLTSRMLLTHLVAAALAAPVLARADAGLWLTRVLLRAVRRRRPAVVRAVVVPDRPVASPVPVLVSLVTSAPVGRRGPPVLLRT